MTTCREVDVVLEVIKQILLAESVMGTSSQRTLDVFEPVVDAPETKWYVLTKVTDDDLELREAVEYAVGDDSQKVQRHAVREA